MSTNIRGGLADNDQVRIVLPYTTMADFNGLTAADDWLPGVKSVATTKTTDIDNWDDLLDNW